METAEFPAVAALVKDKAVARCMRFGCARTDREARAVFGQYCGTPGQGGRLGAAFG